MTPEIEFLEFRRALVSDLNFWNFFFDFVASELGIFAKDF